MPRLSIKQMLLLIVITSLAALTFSQTTVHRAASQVQTPTPNGRYQIVLNPEIRADKYLIDTQTGRLWRYVVYTDLLGEPGVWQIQDRVDNAQELQTWFQSNRPKPNQTSPNP
jgi:hypothetical protein